MKYYEKKMTGFSIIFLHECPNCVKCPMAEYQNVLDESTGNSTPRKEISKRKKISPLDNPSPFESEDDDAYDSSEPEVEFKEPLQVPLKKIKVFRKKKDRDVASKTFRSLPVDQPKKKNSCEPIKKNSLKPAKKTKVETVVKPSPVKKDLTVDKKTGEMEKTPGKGTLKRKRWFMEKLNTSNDNYEDDIFENQEFAQFQSLLEEEETDSGEQYAELKTPVFPFSISPRTESPSPTYRDCYSPTELSISRKTSEEYHYRRGKRKKLLDDKKEPSEKKSKSQKKKSDVTKTLEAVVKILHRHRSFLDKSSDDSEDDQYYSDCFAHSSPTTTLIA